MITRAKLKRFFRRDEVFYGAAVVIVLVAYLAFVYALATSAMERIDAAYSQPPTIEVEEPDVR